VAVLAAAVAAAWHSFVLALCVCCLPLVLPQLLLLLLLV
jgi:hypothetical protein